MAQLGRGCLIALLKPIDFEFHRFWSSNHTCNFPAESNCGNGWELQEMVSLHSILWTGGNTLFVFSFQSDFCTCHAERFTCMLLGGTFSDWFGILQTFINGLQVSWSAADLQGLLLETFHSLKIDARFRRNTFSEPSIVSQYPKFSTE